ncbi:MAG: phosphohistidine phosphatase SixA [Acidobacteria bacterium RIFCSPLOWO2_12_FULL_60_22]|nr:MAG: phosphohistidine phosphatase SixA [Acidobacteria bacterium RIFCSPLOWO2_12_FULL_60_22]
MSETKRISQNRPVSPKSGTPRTNPDLPRAEGRGQSPFQIFFMRHGIAVQRGVPLASDDDARPLTAKGKKRVEQVAAGLRKLGYEPDWIVTSPLVRATETAEIVATCFPTRVPVDVCAALRPGGSSEDLFSFLTRHRDRRKVLLVGHEPDLSELAARLIGAGAQAKLAFKKCGCCLIRCDSRPPRFSGQLVWWLTPRLLRAIR